MVDDGPDEATRAVAARHGARYVAHDAPRGLNAARNTALDATDGDARCFVDDDVEVRPAGWPRCSPPPPRCPTTSACSPARSARASRTTASAPAGARGRRSRSWTSAPPTSTRRTPGARTWRSAAARSSASGASTRRASSTATSRSGRRALRAAGGRIRYVAAAALDHRRAGDDARLRALCARRLPPRRRPAGASTSFKGARAVAGAPSCACWPAALLHGPRRRCMNGAGAGRAQRSGACAPRWPRRARRRRAGRRTSSRAPAAPSAAGAARCCARRDALARRARRAAPRALRRAARRAPPRRRVLVARRRAARGSLMAARARRAAAQPPRRRRRHRAAGRRAASSRTSTRCSPRTRPRPTTGCSSSTTTSRCRAASSTRFLCAAERAGLQLAQPAHRLHSHAAWAVTRRRAGRDRARDDVRGDRAGHRLSPRHVRRAAAVPDGLRDGLGPRRPLGGAWPREHGWPIGDRRRHAGRPHARRRGSGYARDAADRRGARVPRRPARTCAATRSANAGGAPVKVAVVAEYYPRAHDPVLGVWAHRQALAARDAGADVRVLVLHRPVPPRATRLRDAPRRRCARCAAPAAARDARRHRRSRYVPFLAPPRSRSYGSLGRVGGADARASRCAGCAARSRSTSSTPTTRCPPATPCCARADRARRSSSRSTAATSTTPRRATGRRARPCARAFGARGWCWPTRAGHRASARARSAPRARASCTSAPTCRRRSAAPGRRRRRSSRSAHLVARKRHADVLRALWLLRDRHPELRYLVIGDGPERARARARSPRELGVADRVEFLGQLPPSRRSRARAPRTCS